MAPPRGSCHSVLKSLGAATASVTPRRAEPSPSLGSLAGHLRGNLDGVSSQLAETTELVRRELAVVKRELEEIKNTVQQINSWKKKQTPYRVMHGKPTYPLALSMLAYPPYLIPSILTLQYFKGYPSSSMPTFKIFPIKSKVEYFSQSPICNWISTVKSRCNRKRKTEFCKHSNILILKAKFNQSKVIKNGFKSVCLLYKHKMIKYLKSYTLLNITLFSRNPQKYYFFNFQIPHEGTNNFIQCSNERHNNKISKAIDNFCTNNDEIIKKLNKKCILDRKVNIMNAMDKFCTDNIEILKRLSAKESCLLDSDLDNNTCNNSLDITSQRIDGICEVMSPHSVEAISVSSDSEVENIIYSNECNSDCSEGITIPQYIWQHVIKNNKSSEKSISSQDKKNIEISQMMLREPLKELHLNNSENIINYNTCMLKNIVNGKKDEPDACNIVLKMISNPALLHSNKSIFNNNVSFVSEECMQIFLKLNVESFTTPEDLKTLLYYSQAVDNDEQSMIDDLQNSSSNIPVSSGDLKIGENIIIQTEQKNGQVITLNKSVGTQFCADIAQVGTFWKIRMGPINRLRQYLDFVFLKYSHKQSLSHSSPTFLDIGLVFNTQLPNANNVYEVVHFKDSFRGLLKEYFTLVDISFNHDIESEQKRSLYSKYSAIASKSPIEFRHYLMYLLSRFMRNNITSRLFIYRENTTTVREGVGSIFLFVNINLVKELMQPEYTLLIDPDLDW